MTRYDIQQVCENGHQITGAYHCEPENRADFCSECGARTLIACPSCSKEIQGEEIEQDWHDNWHGTGYAEVPSHCSGCGKPYPWTRGAVSQADSHEPGANECVGNGVFIVHGHNETVKLDVARFIEKLGLNPCILHEQPNQGRTLIEKFEQYSSVGFATVLLTADDQGGPQGDNKNLKPRARQNVILELGFFLGKLGRNRVCALYEDGVEIPSDYEGVAYTPLSGDWKLQLAREVKAAGIDIDLNRAV